MPDYKLGKIYIVWGEYEKYYGSTTTTLSRRMSQHRTTTSKHCTIHKLFNKYGVENCYIELVENFPCNSKEELQKREGWYIRNNDCVNKNIPYQTQNEYKLKNKDKISFYQKEYHQQYQFDNKEKLKEYKAQWYSDNKERTKAKASEKMTCECGSIIQIQEKSRHERSKKHINHFNLLL